jgi:hypothetical protein
MAIVNVTEYPGVSVQSSGIIQIPAGPPTASYDIAVGGSSVTGQTFAASTRLVRLHSDVPCRVAEGPAGSVVAAVGSSPRFAANQTEYWGVPASGMAIACITSS